jgi:hypothetical protein
LNKIVSTKRSSAIFLTIILVIGTITVFSPLSASSFMTAEVEGNNMYVVWGDTYSSDTFIAVSNDNGQTFSTPININNNAEISLFPQILTEGNIKYMVWGDTYSSDTFIAVSNDNGQTFSTPININNNAEGSVISQMSSTS